MDDELGSCFTCFQIYLTLPPDQKANCPQCHREHFGENYVVEIDPQDWEEHA